MLSAYWFVNQRGTDLDTCGNWSMPCGTIRHAVKMSENGDQIYIDSAKGRPYMECENVTESTCSIELNKTISFHGINGRPTIKCKRSYTLFVLKNSNLNVPKVGFYNLVFTSTYTVAECSKSAGCDLVVENTTFIDNFLGLRCRDSENCLISIHNSTFRENTFWAIRLSCTNLTTHLTNSVFQKNRILLQQYPNNWQTSVEVFVRNSFFDGQYMEEQDKLFSIQCYAMMVNVSIFDSLFVNNAGYSSLSIFDGAPGNRIETYISLRNITVKNNWNAEMGAVHLKTVFNKEAHFEVEILNSYFKNNSPALVIVVSNYARRQDKAYSMKPTVLRNNTFTQNSNGKTSFGYMPAIYFFDGKHEVTACRFYDNKAKNGSFFAVVTVFKFAVVTFTDCYFENRQTFSAATQLFATGKSVDFKGENVFNMLALNKGQVIFMCILLNQQKGIVNINNFRIICPQGYVLKTQTKCKKHPMTCTYMQITCEECPPKTYTLERSQFIFNSRKNIKCTQCPRGGNCVSGIVKALPNFWGYKTNVSITFAQCPPGYCCNSKDCVRYNSCHGNRTGTLCGRCPVGMSDSLFGSQCTPNTECSMSLFIPGAVAMLVAYLIFFLYHEEIVSVVGKSLFGSLRVFRRREKTGTNLESRKSGLLKVIFYYYQVVSLLRSSVGPQNGNEIVGKLRDDVSRVLNMVLVNVPSFSCPVKSLHPVQKDAILHSVGYCLLGLLGITYFTDVVVRMLLKRVQSNPIEMRSLIANAAQQHRPKFTARIASAFTYISLVMYASSAQLCLSLLHCVPVNDEQVLFLDGNIRCYQTFQYYILVYVVSSVFPFCLVPVLGSYLLKLDRISVRQFCVACMFPLPFCCFWSYLLLKDYRTRKKSSNDTAESERVVRRTGDDDLIEHCEGQMNEGQDSVEYKVKVKAKVRVKVNVRHYVRRPLIKEHLR